VRHKNAIITEATTHPMSRVVGPIVTGTALTKESDLLGRTGLFTAQTLELFTYASVALAGHFRQITARHAMQYAHGTAEAFGHV
jgi:hypothetical protein